MEWNESARRVGLVDWDKAYKFNDLIHGARGQREGDKESDEILATK
jgi:hypothetical protein